jgi:hypothetical protein
MSSAFRKLHTLDAYRRPLHGEMGDETCGAFTIPSPVMGTLSVVASAGLGWDHVSVSTPNRLPTWTEMEHVKRLFWKPDAVVMQLHVAEKDHINLHPYCLHLWRPHSEPVPLPPKEMVV